jgi:hypothetical protein
MWADISIGETMYRKKSIPHQDFFQIFENFTKDASICPESFFLYKIVKFKFFRPLFDLLK